MKDLDFEIGTRGHWKWLLGTEHLEAKWWIGPGTGRMFLEPCGTPTCCYSCRQWSVQIKMYIYILYIYYTHIKEISEYLINCPSICFATTRIADPSKQHGACISPCHITWCHTVYCKSVFKEAILYLSFPSIEDIFLVGFPSILKQHLFLISPGSTMKCTELQWPNWRVFVGSNKHPTFPAVKKSPVAIFCAWNAL